MLVITSCSSRSECTCCSRSAKRRGTIRFRDFAAESFTRYEGNWRVSTERDTCNQCRRGTQRFNVSHTQLTSTKASGSEDFHGRRERSRQDGVGDAVCSCPILHNSVIVVANGIPERP